MSDINPQRLSSVTVRGARAPICLCTLIVPTGDKEHFLAHRAEYEAANGWGADSQMMVVESDVIVPGKYLLTRTVVDKVGRLTRYSLRAEDREVSL